MSNFNMKWLTYQDYEECVNDVEYLMLNGIDLDKIQNLSHYKNTCLRNLLVTKQINQSKKHVKQIQYNYNELVLNPTSFKPDYENDDYDEQLKKLSFYINLLPKKQKEIINKLLSDDTMTLAKIAKLTKQKQNTVKSNYRHALKTLRTHMLNSENV